MIKNKISRFFVIFLVLTLVLGLVACDKNEEENKKTSSLSTSSNQDVASYDNNPTDTSSDDNTSDDAVQDNVSDESVNSNEAASSIITKTEKIPVVESSTSKKVVIKDKTSSIKTYTNKWGVYEMLKSYTNKGSKVTADEFLPSVGYMHLGKIKDTMFDSFVFLPSPTEEIGIEMDQKFIKSYIYDTLYRENYNINALEEATGKVKKTLGKKDYTVNVFLPLFRPLETVTEFGEYNGKKINCSTEEGRLEALKWFIDEHIKAFNSKKFKNLKLVGFYWFDEYAENKHYPLIQKMNDYIHSKNYITIWSPFFNAGGWGDWKLMKFDIATMQSNYFPATPEGLNAGGVDRLSINAQYTEFKGMGMEMEASDFNTNAGIRGFKETMQSMLANGRIDFVHMYYIDNGPICVYQWYNHKSKYGQSVYHELHRFIKRTLKDDDIMF